MLCKVYTIFSTSKPPSNILCICQYSSTPDIYYANRQMGLHPKSHRPGSRMPAGNVKPLGSLSKSSLCCHPVRDTASDNI